MLYPMWPFHHDLYIQDPAETSKVMSFWKQWGIFAGPVYMMQMKCEFSFIYKYSHGANIAGHAHNCMTGKS